MTELKACPFCGGEAQVRSYREDMNFAQCKVCLAMTRDYPMPEEAVERWNTRNTFLTRLKRRVAAWLMN